MMRKLLTLLTVLSIGILSILVLPPVSMGHAQSMDGRFFACTAYHPSSDGYHIGSTFVVEENGGPRTFDALGVTPNDVQVSLKRWTPMTHQGVDQLALVINLNDDAISGKAGSGLFKAAGPADSSTIHIDLPALTVSCRHLTDSVELELHRFVEQFLDAYHVQKLDAMWPFYNEETALLPPTGETFSGLSGVQEYLGPRFGGTVRQQAAEIVSVNTNGNFGTIRSNTYIQAVPKDGGTPQAFAFRVMTLVKKTPEGWKVYRDLTQSSKLEVLR